MDGMYSALSEHGFTVHRVPVRPATWPKTVTVRDKLIFFPRLLYWYILNKRSQFLIREIVREYDIRLIHTNVSIVNVGFKVSRKERIPHIYHIREYGEKDFGIHYFPCKKRLIREMTDNDSYTICITKDIQRYHGLSQSESSLVIYNGICKRSALILRDKEGYFLFAGRIEPAKGLYELVKAYAKYVKEIKIAPLKLLIAGGIVNPSYFYSVMRYINNNKLSRYIDYVGAVSDMKDLMSHANAIIIPSICEGFGRCMAEASSLGCLVIGNNTGGTKEQFDNGLRCAGREIGLRYNNLSELTYHLVSVTEKGDSAYASMIESAHKTVCGIYTEEINVNKVAELYNRILSK